jgi:hypothetical protein
MSATKLMAAVFWDREGVELLLIYATRDHNIRSAL